MAKKQFYHCCLPAILLAALALAPAVAAVPIDAEAIRPPPRSINDVTRMLADYRQQDDLVGKLRDVADAEAPATEARATLFDFYWKRGLAAGELGRVPQQIADLRRAVDLGQVGTVEYARALRNLAQAERLGGNFMSARHYLEEAVKQIPQRNQGQLTGAYAQIVSLASQVGDFETAQATLRLLEATIASLRNSKNWAVRSQNWLANYEKARGDLFAMSGKPLEAEGAYRRSLRESERVQAEHSGRAALFGDGMDNEGMQQAREGTQRSIAQVLMVQGKLVEAEAMARRSLEQTLQRSGRASPDVGRGLRLLAIILAEQGRYAESAQLADAALAAVLESGAAPDSIVALAARRSTLAAQVALGNDREALRIFEDMKRLLRPHPVLAEQLLKGGDLDVVLALLRTGQAEAAEGMAAAMLAAARQQQGEHGWRVAEIQSFLAMAQADLGKPDEALAGFRQSVPVLIERGRNDSEAESGSTRRQQRLVIALERYIRLLAERQAAGLASAEAANEAFVLADEARGSSVQRALSRSAARAAIRDPQLAELARQEQDAQRRGNALSELLSQLLAAAPDQQLPAIQAQIRHDIDALRESRERLKKEIGQRFPDYARLVDPPPVDIAQVQKMLRPGEVLLSWYLGRQGAQVWAIGADGRNRFAALATDRATVAGQVARLRRALTPEVATIDQIPPFDVALAAQMYGALLGPVAESLDGAHTLLVVPHGELGQLPLALLVSEPVAQPAAGGLLFAGYRTVPWLMRKAAIAQLPSVTALASLRRLPPGDAGRWPFIGFGDPYFSEAQAREAERKTTAGPQVAMRGLPLRLRNVPKTQAVDMAELALLPRLPDTAEEIRDIASALGAEPSRDVFLHAAASERNVFAADLANRRVVMFATHGLVPGELDGLGQPALALSAPQVAGGEGDGLLTQEEILSLKLNADWVVLSACNTAAGEGAGSEAVSGLGRAFFYAGARALLVSNWPVESEASRRLMTDLFRRQAAAPGLSKALALRQAMAGMVDGPGRLDAKTGKSLFSYAHPLFWAPFVLVGD